MPTFVLGNRVLVLPEKQQEKSQGGIIIPVVANTAVHQGVVLAVGDSVINIEEADRIIYPAGAGIPYEIDGIDHIFIDGPTKDSPGNIIAII
jgi:chaperonin GroES